jgi:hypothetical protein
MKLHINLACIKKIKYFNLLIISTWIISNVCIAQPGEMSIQIFTGSDDLRGGNDNFGIAVLCQNGAVHRFNNVNKGARLADRTNKTFIITLPGSITRHTQISGIRLETMVSGGMGGDNWNIDRLIVDVKIGGASNQIINESGNPLVRFTGENRSKDFLIKGGSLPAAKAVMTRFDPKIHGFKFVNSFKNIVYRDIHTGGLCGGMVYASLDYFNQRKPIPTQNFMPAEGQPLQSYLYNRQVAALSKGIDRWAELAANPGGSRNREFFSWGIQPGAGGLGKLIARLDKGQPTPLGLWECGGDCNCRDEAGTKSSCPGSHYVLAIGYETGRYKFDLGNFTEDITIFVYDPNHPGETMRLKPDANGAFYYYPGKPNGSDKRWRAYFTDERYSSLNPPVFETENRMLVVQFQTGDDDLRGGKDNVNLELTVKGRPAPIVFNNVNESKRWIGKSSQTISRRLPDEVGMDEILSIRVSTTFGGGIGGDNWDLDFIMIKVIDGNNECLLLERGRKIRITYSGTPPDKLIRFTGNKRQINLQINAAERKCP